MRLRHSRASEFDAAAQEPAVRAARTWRDLSANPNSALATLHRAGTLRDAWREPVYDRLRLLRQLCTGKRVLDIGCVAHEASRMDSAMWLHRHLAEVASFCVGVDVDPGGVAAMNSVGFTAMHHDLGQGLGPIAQYGQFDVIVAGELVEHVESLGMVFRTAGEALAPDGCLIITTPNPYAPWRVRAGQRGIIWENADHISYLFPSGVAELAERHRLVLSQAFTVERKAQAWQVEPLRRAYRRFTGRQWLDVGWRSRGPLAAVRLEPLRSRISRIATLPRNTRFLGETFVYVVVRGGDGGNRADR